MSFLPRPRPVLPPDALPVAQVLSLVPGRAHEFCGRARRVLALWAIAAHAPKGPVLWFRLRWDRDRFCPQGVLPWLDPDRLIMGYAPRASDILACAEDALRSGACAAVVADLPEPPGLVPLRRLHLAAAEGVGRRRSRDPAASLHALVLTPGQGGAPGVETRWHMAPCPAPRALPDELVQPAWTLARLRARLAPPADWHVDADMHAHPRGTAAGTARAASSCTLPGADLPGASRSPSGALYPRA